MKQVQVEIAKNEFVETFMKEVEEFRAHVQRVKAQYTEMKKLRGNLELGHVMIRMDFTCPALEEVQSAYWNTSMITLHTAVAYFPKGHGKSHMSVAGVSETLQRNYRLCYDEKNYTCHQRKLSCTTFRTLPHSLILQHHNTEIRQYSIVCVTIKKSLV